MIIRDTQCRTLELTALRRNSDSTAERLRREVPVLLGRLAAEVRGATIELKVATYEDGDVHAELAVAAGDATDELFWEVSAALTPVAEVEETDPHDGWTAWPLLACPRAPLGFGTGDRRTAVPWNTSAAKADLAALVCRIPSSGVRVRIRSTDAGESRQPMWAVDAAAVTGGLSPSLRLRAQIREAFPALRIADTADAEPAVLRVAVDDLPKIFAVPVGGDEPTPGFCTGSAAPIPILPTRRTKKDHSIIRLGLAETASGREVPVEMGGQERLRHVHVLGRTGTGKSSFLAGFAHEVARGEEGMLVLDPHGHLVDRIIAELPAAAAAHTWVIRCGDTDNPVPVNPLAVDDPTRREIAIDDVCAVFQNLFDKKNTGIVGPRFRERVAMGLRALSAVFDDRTSLLDVPAALASTEFLTRAANASPDDRLKAWLANDISNRRSGEYADLVSWVNSKFEMFSSTAALRGILGSGADAIDMAAAMDSGRIILVDLSKTQLGESATSLLGYLYLNKVWTAALQRTKAARPFTVVVDEAQALISGSLSTMLSEGRKFGLSVVVAHQYLGQLDEDLRPAVDGNVATTVAFRGAVADLPALRQRFGGNVDEATLMTLPDLSAVMVRSAGAVAEPHTLLVDHNRRVRARIGEPRATFEADIVASTVRELVDDYREDTAPAASGKSNVVAMTAKKPPRPKAPPPKAGSFLDEWMAKRAQQAAAADGDADSESSQTA